MIVLQKFHKLMLSAADRIALIIWIVPVEHVEYHDGILIAVQEQAVCHCEFIEIRDHCRIVVIFIRNINFSIDTHNFPLITVFRSGRIS